MLEPTPLPPPHSPPTGHWMHKGKSIATISPVPDSIPALASSLRSDRMNFQKDDDKFYYDAELPEGPVHEFYLTCRHFRHGLGPVPFTVEIFPQVGDVSMRGSVKVRVHASNLGQLAEEIVPIEVATEELPVVEYAERFIEMVQLRPDAERRRSKYGF
jgi:hypothetical protein